MTPAHHAAQQGREPAPGTAAATGEEGILRRILPIFAAQPAPVNASAAPAPGRDRAVDVARLAALVVVMFGHCALLLATIDGGLRIGNILGELPELAPITWLVQVMPLFFLAGGAAGAYSWHPGRTAWGTWLFSRAQRLCRPVFWYLAFWSLGLLVVRLVLGAESAASMGRECVALLWFLGVYLVVLAFVPLLTKLPGVGAAAVVVLGLIGAAAGFDALRFAVGTPEAGVANFVIVWLIPVVIGVAYARQMLRPLAALSAAIVAMATGCSTNAVVHLIAMARRSALRKPSRTWTM